MPTESDVLQNTQFHVNKNLSYFTISFHFEWLSADFGKGLSRLCKQNLDACLKKIRAKTNRYFRK